MERQECIGFYCRCVPPLQNERSNLPAPSWWMSFQGTPSEAMPPQSLQSLFLPHPHQVLHCLLFCCCEKTPQPKGTSRERVHFGLWFLRSRVHHGGKSWPDSRNRKLADGSFNPTQKTEKAGGGVRLYTPPPVTPRDVRLLSRLYLLKAS